MKEHFNRKGKRCCPILWALFGIEWAYPKWWPKYWEKK